MHNYSHSEAVGFCESESVGCCENGWLGFRELLAGGRQFLLLVLGTDSIDVSRTRGVRDLQEAPYAKVLTGRVARLA
jgi:hypothetical protein